MAVPNFTFNIVEDFLKEHVHSIESILAFILGFMVFMFFMTIFIVGLLVMIGWWVF